ncbi:cyclin f-box [Fusarium langsethiae]|uniref:Cyclin f-box n=1 Tax=Fusarium langsethiae TaxID=179993 RepID=A0A0M9ETJ3_FUSLA|nr:cyclin f-box [Fusarium langsethiae]GKU05061.1 unnamed protein product [Fusarium langsethiae]GKU21359.1 unnamed protein product [Fusarium langsethiae]
MTHSMPRGYISATEYKFDQEQADAIVRTVTYHRRDLPLSVIWFSPREHTDIQIATPFQRTSNVGLGYFDQLPTELLDDILFRLDTQSLFRFRQINLRSRQTIDSLNKYQAIVSHGLNLFCALLRTRLAADVSLLDFYNALCTKGCSLCGDFGGFMSLLTWKRCCFKCLRDAPEMQVDTLDYVQKRFCLTETESARLRSFKTLPGIYTMGESMFELRAAVASVHQASLIRSPQVPPKSGLVQSKRFNYMGSCALPYYDETTGNVEHGISCAGCQLALEKRIIGSRTRQADDTRKLYARDGFLEHFRWCEQAQLLWRTSDQGNKRPPKLPESVERGGRFSKRE